MCQLHEEVIDLLAGAQSRDMSCTTRKHNRNVIQLIAETPRLRHRTESSVVASAVSAMTKPLYGCPGKKDYACSVQGDLKPGEQKEICSLNCQGRHANALITVPTNGILCDHGEEMAYNRMSAKAINFVTLARVLPQRL